MPIYDGQKKEKGIRGKKPRDITGQKFGRLTAVRRLDRKCGNSYVWLCRCDCGNMTEVSVNSLSSGNTTSCGCARKEALRKRAKDISGQTFGMLTALEPLDKRQHGGVVWKCRCSCGTICEVTYNSLTSGNTSSCGCLRKEHPQPPLHYVDGTCIEMINHRILRKDNTSGHTGVVALRDGKWKAEIFFKGKREVLGTYTDFDRAVEARKKAENRIFGEFLDTYYLQPGQEEEQRKPIPV